MLDDLHNWKHSVVLIPAPDPMHSDHKIRVCETASPKWYSELCAEHVSIRGIGRKRYVRPRTFIKRADIIKALERIIENRPTGMINEVRLLKMIQREFDRKRARKNFVPMYERPGMHDLPF